MARPMGLAKEICLCDVCGNRLVIPPGVYYRGRRMHKHEAAHFKRQDFCSEVLGPERDRAEREITQLLDVGTST